MDCLPFGEPDPLICPCVLSVDHLLQPCWTNDSPESDRFPTVIARYAGFHNRDEAEIIRQAIDRHVQSLQISGAEMAFWETEDAFIEKLMQLGPVTGERTWKREDLYDR